MPHSQWNTILYWQIRPLGEAFDYKLPSKEDFLNDAEECFQMLSNSIDRFTEVSLGGKEFGQGELVEDKTEEGEISQVVEKITSQADQQRLFREAVVLHSNGNYDGSSSWVE